MMTFEAIKKTDFEGIDYYSVLDVSKAIGTYPHKFRGKAEKGGIILTPFNEWGPHDKAIRDEDLVNLLKSYCTTLRDEEKVGKVKTLLTSIESGLSVAVNQSNPESQPKVNLPVNQPTQKKEAMSNQPVKKKVNQPNRRKAQKVRLKERLDYVFQIAHDIIESSILLLVLFLMVAGVEAYLQADLITKITNGSMPMGAIFTAAIIFQFINVVISFNQHYTEKRIRNYVVASGFINFILGFFFCFNILLNVFRLFLEFEGEMWSIDWSIRALIASIPPFCILTLGYLINKRINKNAGTKS